MNKYLIIPDRFHIEKSLKLVKEYNVGFELNDFYFPAVLRDKSKTEEILSFYSNIDMPDICTSHGDFFDVTIFSIDKDIADISKKRMIQSMNIAKKLRLSGVVFHSNINHDLTAGNYHNGWLVANDEFLHELCSKYPKINIYIENMFDKVPNDMLKLAEKMADVKNFGICLDYSHAALYGKNVDEWVEVLSPYIRHVHINDHDGQSDLHLAIGDGITDWNHFNEQRIKYFNDATILIESPSYESQKVSLKRLKELGALY